MNFKHRFSDVIARTKAKFGSNNVEHTPVQEEQPKELKYEHQVILNQMLQTISSCPMDDELKTIMRMRIWGMDPQVYSPMSYKDIADLLKTREENVIRWEQDALYNMEQFLNRTGIVAIAEKFLKDNDVKKIVDPKKRIIV